MNKDQMSKLTQLRNTVNAATPKKEAKSVQADLGPTQESLTTSVLTEVIAKVAPGLEIAVKSAEQSLQDTMKLKAKVDRTAVKMDDISKALMMATESFEARLCALEGNEKSFKDSQTKLTAKLDTMSTDFNEKMKLMFAQITSLKEATQAGTKPPLGPQSNSRSNSASASRPTPMTSLMNPILPANLQKGSAAYFSPHGSGTNVKFADDEEKDEEGNPRPNTASKLSIEERIRIERTMVEEQQAKDKKRVQLQRQQMQEAKEKKQALGLWGEDDEEALLKGDEVREKMFSTMKASRKSEPGELSSKDGRDSGNKGLTPSKSGGDGLVAPTKAKAAAPLTSSKSAGDTLLPPMKSKTATKL